MNGGYRTTFNNLDKSPALRLVKNGPGTRRFLVNQAVSTCHVEPENPVSDDLQPHTPDPRRIRTPTAIVYLGEHKEPAALSRIPGRLR